MKLRNKKTGEIAERSSIVTLRYKISSSSSSLVEAEEFGSIEQLNEEWEDYNPAEPLIKDKKIRKAVRAWAEANAFINEIKVEGLNAGTRFSEGHWSIEFIGYFIYDLKIDSIYTIVELCGEDEE